MASWTVTPVKRSTFETKLGGNYTATLEEHDRGAPEEIRITAGGFAASRCKPAGNVGDLAGTSSTSPPQ